MFCCKSNLKFEAFCFYLILIIFTCNSFHFLIMKMIIVILKIIRKDLFNYIYLLLKFTEYEIS